jgi:hypothetical protein
MVAPLDCNPPATETIQYSFIEGILEASTCGGSSCSGNYYTYTISYDDAQLTSYSDVLLAATDPVESSDVYGVFCYGCFAHWAEQLAGNEIDIQETLGVVTVTTQHGCTYEIDISDGFTLTNPNAAVIRFTRPDGTYDEINICALTAANCPGGGGGTCISADPGNLATLDGLGCIYVPEAESVVACPSAYFTGAPV